MTTFTTREDFYGSVVVDLTTNWFIDPWTGSVQVYILIGSVCPGDLVVLNLVTDLYCSYV